MISPEQYVKAASRNLAWATVMIGVGVYGGYP